MEDLGHKCSQKMVLYWQSLGQFIDQYAEAEAAISGVLWHLTKVTPSVGRAVFSGTRADAATKYISRLLEVKKIGQLEKNHIKYLFDHFGEITKTRNDIVHYGTQYNDDGDFIVTNERVALNKSKLREHSITANVLDQMSHDLEVIIADLFAFLVRKSPHDLRIVRMIYAKHIGAPWRYKFHAPSSQDNKRSPRPPKRPRQPQSSQV